MFDQTAVSTDYTVSENLGTLTVTANTTSLAIVSATTGKEYDGTALTAPAYTITYGSESGTATLNAETGKYEYTLPTGDKIVITPAATATVTHVAEGTVTNAFTYTLANATNYEYWVHVVGDAVGDLFKILRENEDLYGLLGTRHEQVERHAENAGHHIAVYQVGHAYAPAAFRRDDQ